MRVAYSISLMRVWDKRSYLIYFLVSLVTAHLTDGVLEHSVLLKEVVDSFLALSVVVHRALEEEAQETLDAIATGTVSQVRE